MKKQENEPTENGKTFLTESGDFQIGEAILTIEIQPSVFHLNEVQPTINLTFESEENTVANNGYK